MVVMAAPAASELPYVAAADEYGNCRLIFNRRLTCVLVGRPLVSCLHLGCPYLSWLRCRHLMAVP